MKPVVDIEKTGKHLKDLCERNNLSVSALQKELHLKCPQSMYRWFNGAALPTVDHLYKLSCLFHVPIEGLLVFKNETISEEHINDILKWCGDQIGESYILRKTYWEILGVIILPVDNTNSR